MKYAALLTNMQEDIDAWKRMTPEEATRSRAEEIPKWEALFNELGPTCALGDGYELDVPDTAKTVRVRDGETLVTDGPFAETKEQIGGAFFLDLPDLDEAIRIAALIPTARTGSMEIRPIVE